MSVLIYSLGQTSLGPVKNPVWAHPVAQQRFPPWGHGGNPVEGILPVGIYADAVTFFLSMSHVRRPIICGIPNVLYANVKL